MKSFEIINRPVAKGQIFEWVTIVRGEKVLVSTIDFTIEGTVGQIGKERGFMLDNLFISYGSILRIDKAA